MGLQMYSNAPSFIAVTVVFMSSKAVIMMT